MQQILGEDNFNVPNVLTVLRVVLLPILVALYQSGRTLAALGVYLAAMLTDVLDGTIARKTNQITVLGKLLDPVADKLSLVTVLALFVAAGQIPSWILIAVLVKEMLLIVGGVFALKRGRVVSALPIGKAATLTFTASMILRFLDITMPSDLLLYGSLVLSFGAFLRYAVVMYGRQEIKQNIAVVST